MVRFYMVAWYAAALGILSLFPEWKFGVPVWSLPKARLLPWIILSAAMPLGAAVARVFSQDGWRRALCGTISTVACYGLAVLALFIAQSDFSRAVLLSMFFVAIILNLIPHLLLDTWPKRIVALTAMLAVFPLNLIAPDLGPRVFAKFSAGPTSLVRLRSAYYNLSLASSEGPRSQVHGGALARIDDRYLLLSGDGRLYVFGLSLTANHADFRALPYRVPINGEEFSTAAKRPWAAGRGEFSEYDSSAQSEVLHAEWFRTYGLLVQEVGADTRIFVSHAFWHADKSCFAERVSMLQANRQAIIDGASDLKWRTLYETTPCLPVHGEHRRHGIPFVGYFGGGRLQMLDPQTILLSVGDFGFDGVAADQAVSQDPLGSYGKTIAININDGRAKMFTLGHRNPQGLYVDRGGDVWSTEHGPFGGDKLNRLIEGGNYGWPYATFGTDYGSLTWPLNKPESDWHAYQDPLFAWVPSIGVSNLMMVERSLFSRWRGDLLIASLKEKTLFRAHLRGGHVAYLESLQIGSRIRDVIEGHAGEVLLWTDDDRLVVITPSTGNTGEVLFEEKCSGCHQSALVSGNRIGPNLTGVFRRPIASQTGYADYSTALRRMGGAWTAERLEKFLQNPSAACPGTAMDFAGISEASARSAIIEYLKTIQ